MLGRTGILSTGPLCSNASAPTLMVDEKGFQETSSLDELYTSYRIDLRDQGEKVLNKDWFARTLKKYFPHIKKWRAVDKTEMPSWRRPYLKYQMVKFGGMEQCRRSFEEITGIKVEIESTSSPDQTGNAIKDEERLALLSDAVSTL